MADSKRVDVLAKAKKPEKAVPENEADEIAASKTPETPPEIAETPVDDDAPLEGTIFDEPVDAPSEEIPKNEEIPENRDVSDPLDETVEPSDDPLTEEIEAEPLEEDIDAVEPTPEEIAAREEEPVEEVVEEQPKPTPPPVEKTGSMWPAVFGGVIAALLGFIAGRGDQLEAYLPGAMQRQSVDLAPLVEQTSTLAEANVELIARVEDLESATPDTALPDAVTELQTAVSDLEGLQTSITELTERLAALEARPAETVETVIQQPADNSEEISALQSAVEALQAQISEEEARATAEAERILAQAALTRVVTAVESGEAFEPALGALEEVTPVEVPEALRAAAIEGVPSMAMLRENFPDAARAGLAAARAEVPETEVSGISGFLRRQLSARSVTPREGSDPDAVLSRAEAAVKAGSLDEALAELDALPDASKTAMQDWLEGAKARQTAREAAQNLADSLTVN